MPRKHLIVGGIVKQQQQQAKLWMKIAREIKVASKEGGPNPEANPRLKAAIDKALRHNLSRESIHKNINGQKDDVNIEEIEYEAYGPNGLAIILKILTDNNNRTLSSIRGFLNKLPGNLSKSNTAKTVFEYKGIILVKKESFSLDNFFEKIIDFNINDLSETDDYFRIIALENDYYQVLEYLKKNNFGIIEAELNYIPLNSIDLTIEQREKLIRFLEQCDEDDDIQAVYTNYNWENEKD
ncbi:MAG: YebC/PmpR family DNA-binding transcriptional regulator [Mycoplasmoidaceae bacterium]